MRRLLWGLGLVVSSEIFIRVEFILSSNMFRKRRHCKYVMFYLPHCLNRNGFKYMVTVTNTDAESPRKENIYKYLK